MNKRIEQILGFTIIKEKLSTLALSNLAKEKALAIAPETDFDQINKLIQETKEAESITLHATTLPVTGFDAVRSECARLKHGAGLNAAELLKIKRILQCAKRAKMGIQKDEEGKITILPGIASGLFYDDELIHAIDHAIISEDQIADDASAALREIRRKIRIENDQIREKLNDILRSHDQSKYLQDEIITMRNGRFVVPVRQEYRANIKGLVHGQSQSGATLFIEPMGVVEANNRLKVLEEEEQAEIERILMMLSDEIRPFEEELRWNEEILSYLDLVFAKAALAIRMRANPPELTREKTVKIIKGRHPLIADNQVIPLSFEIKEGTNVLIITGPNTGGKTVTLKLMGLFALMAQSGMFLPAEQGTTIPVFSAIYADIGDEQSIEQSLSTFSSHMKNIIDITNYADEHALILLDELGAGTDPEEGSSLAMAILSYLANKGALLFATTHYSEIKSFAVSADGFENASMEFDLSSLKPTYRLISGVSGASNALLVSKRLGISEEIICSAQSFLKEERKLYDNLLMEAEKKKKQAEEELVLAKTMKDRAHQTETEAKQREEEFEKKREKLLETANKQAAEIIKEAQDTAERIILELKQAKKLSQPEVTKTIDRSRKKLKEKREKSEQVLSKKEKEQQKILPKEAYKEGDEVRIISLGVDGTLLTAPDQKGMAVVQAGIMKLNICYTDLTKRKQEQKKKPKRTASVSIGREPVGLSLNVQGYTVEEAILEVDQYLDDAFLCGLTEVTIIHGKGTGVLRNGIWRFIKGHTHVKEYRTGTFSEGAEGVTVIKIK